MEAILKPVAAESNTPLADVIDFPLKTDGYSLVHGAVELDELGQVQYTLSVPSFVKDNVMKLFVPGFGGFKRSSRDLRNELANNHGTFGLTYDPLRFGKNLASDAFRSQQVHVDTIAAIKEDLPYNKQLQDTENGDQLDLNQVALLAHSMGGIPAAVTAVSHPDETSELFLMAAVGMEEPNRLRFLPRLLPSLKNELIPPILRREFGDDARTIQLAGKSLEYYGSNLVRTAGEIASCIGADIRPHVAALKPSDVRTIMYYFEEDKLVPAHRSIEASGDLVDYFEIGIGFDHLAPQTRPVEIARNINRISEIAYHKSLAQVTQISI